MRLSLTILFVFITHSIFGQMILNRDTSLIIEENGLKFKSAFAGGINSGQFSEIDLNLDGVMDIIMFDKSGNKISPFINNNGNFIYAPKYRSNFPDTLHDWMLMYDYNCDGKNDIFSYSASSVAVYKNTSNTNLSFTKITSGIKYDGGNPTNPLCCDIYVGPSDIPGIVDIDYDGDLDILTFGVNGGFIKYFKNLSMEQYGNCDSLNYEFSESCWGLFYEGLNSYILNCDSCQCPSITNPSSNTKQKHGSSAILAIDIDNDNDKDLILGDDNFNNLNLLINGGNSQNAIMTSVDSIFPENYTNTLAVNIDVFPSAYYLDITNDGTKDLIVTTNHTAYENFESCWLYKNNGVNNNPDFTFIKKDFLQGEMVELGKSALPTFYDYNNDGLKDLIIGNYGYHNPNNPANPISALALFKNIGNDSIPKYDLINRDWLAISTINLDIAQNIPAVNLSPTFGDLDGDNDKDLIIGDRNGKLHLFTNTGNGNFQISEVNYQNIDVGNFAQPQIIDVNRDGLNDIIVGEQDGIINYFPNSGTTTNAIFDTIITNWGGIDVDQSYISTGYSSPILFDSSGVYQLFVGSFSGSIYQFTNIDGNLNGLFTPVNSTVSTLWDGGKSAIAIADINNDNQVDMVIGNVSGGIAYYSSDTLLIDTTSTSITNINKESFNIFPNPANNSFTISSNKTGIIRIKNILGNTVLTTRKQNKELKIKTHKLKKGIYIVEFNKSIKKLIVR